MPPSDFNSNAGLEFTASGFVRTNLFRPRKVGRDAIHEQSTSLNAAFEALEAMRRANLEVEFGGLVDFDRCEECLRSSHRSLRLRPVIQATIVSLPRCKSIEYMLKSDLTRPCLVCGSSVCGEHSHATFRADGSTICTECSPFFSLDFIVDCVTISKDPLSHRRQHIDRMIGVYDRALLVLKYSILHIDEVINSLGRNAKRNDGVGMGSCIAGMISGVAGVAAATTVCTPMGPPLLIASVLFGCGSSAVSAGSEAANVYCEPSKLAGRIMALDAAVRSLSRLPSVLRDALLRDCIRADAYLDDKNSVHFRVLRRKESTLDEVITEACERKDTQLKLDAGFGSMAVAAKVMHIGRQKQSLLWSRTTRNALKRKASFAHSAFGALSAVSVILEAKELAAVTERLRSGSKCEKVERLKQIKEELKQFPETTCLAQECENYMQAMAKRPTHEY